MASDKEYVRYVLEQLSGLEEISTRAIWCTGGTARSV